MWPGLKSPRRRSMWVEFVVGSLLCSERFFPGHSGFPSPQKLTFPNSDWTRNQVDEEPLCGCDACNRYLFIYLFKSYRFNGFLSDFVETTSCVYTKTIIL